MRDEAVGLNRIVLYDLGIYHIFATPTMKDSSPVRVTPTIY